MTPKQSLADQARRKPPFFWFVVLLGAVMLGLYLFGAAMIWRYGTVTRDFGWKAVRRDGQWVVLEVDPQGPASGKLQAGDVIFAINDEPRIARIDSPDVWLVTAQQDACTLEVKRGSEQRHFELPMVTKHDYRNLGGILSNLAASLAFYLVGLMLGLLKPEDRLTRRAALTLLAWASNTLYISLSQMIGLLTFWERVVLISINLIAPLQFALSYHFYYRFPQSVPRGRFWTALQYLLYIWGGLFYILRLWTDVGRIQTEPAAIDFLLDHAPLMRLRATSAAFELTAVLAMSAVLVRNYRLVKEPDQRRRIKWIIYGSLLGILPAVLYMVLRLTFPLPDSAPISTQGTLRYLSFMIGNFMTVAIPITVGYAVLKHRVFDVRIVVRRGLQHLFAKQVLRLVLVLPLAGLVLTIIVNRDLPLTAILSGNPLLLMLIAAAGLSLKFRRQLTDWIDRRFFREAYSQEQILLNLIEQIKELDSMPELSRLVSKEVESALHPERLYVFYRGEEKRDLQLGYSSGGLSHDLRITEESELLRLMQQQRGAQDFPLPHSGLPEGESAWLSGLGVNLIVPMSGADGRMAGLLLLGEKKSDAPYTPTDRQLLQTITTQMAMVYENVWLKEQAAREQKIKHEVLARFEEQQIKLVKECPACGACYDSASEVCTKDQLELTLSLPVERTIDNKYRLEQLIGRGGMGAVYEATDLRLNRQVAIKIMLGQMFGDRAALRRFEREAQASARLNHPNIISVYDYGTIRTDGAYLVMELVRGRTLRSELNRAGRLDPQTAASWFTQLLEGVKTAHQAGVIHRDLKPENVLISGPAAGREQIKVLDFGLAKILQIEASDPQSLTAPGMVMGTFAYMSPEQVTGEEVDERSDIFSLGAMVVEALTGKRPFPGRTSAELIAAILHTPYHLSGEAPEVRQLDEVLQSCMAKDREERFASVVAMQQALIPAIERCPPFAPATAANDTATISEEATRGLPAT